MNQLVKLFILVALVGAFAVAVSAETIKIPTGNILCTASLCKKLCQDIMYDLGVCISEYRCICARPN